MSESLEGGASSTRYSVPGILHYLQHEFSNYELDKIRWDDERNSLKSQITFLQGERQGHQNIMQCLVKRIKMLENALREARMGSVRVNGEVTGEEEEEEKDELDGIMDPPPPPVNMQVKQGRALLKQYLTEIGSTERLLETRTARLRIMQSLANSETVNHLMKPPVADTGTSPALERTPFEQHSENKMVTMLDEDEDSSDEEKEEEDALRAFDFMGDEDDEEEADDDDDDDGDDLEFSAPISKDNSLPRGLKAGGWSNYDSLDSMYRNGKRFNRKGPMNLYDEEEHSPIPNQLPKGTDNIPSGMKVSTKSNKDFKDIDFLHNNDTKKSETMFSVQSLGELAGIQVANDAEHTYDSYSLTPSNKPILKCSVRAHFDCVRQLCFSPDKLLLFTASDDATLKMWDLDAFTGHKRGGPDVDPLYTFRGHTGAVLSCVCTKGNPESVLFSGGADATVRCWKIPHTAEYNLYDPYDDMMIECQVLEGHSDAVWGLTLHPESVTEVASCSSDGTLCVWDLSREAPLVARIPVGGPASATQYIKTSPDLIAVGLNNSQVQLISVSSAGVVRTLESGMTEDGGVTALDTHPTQPLVIAGYTDREIRVFNTDDGTMVHHMIVHTDAISSISIDPMTGCNLLTASHSLSIRTWNIEDWTCDHEETAHQRRHDEGILCVRFHPFLNFIATSGADSTVRVYG